MARDVAILVHGFNVWDGGKSTVGKLKGYFYDVGVNCIVINYGWFGIGRTYVKNRRVARRVIEACNVVKMTDPDAKIILVGHSNGCAIIQKACEDYKKDIHVGVYINPALDATTTIAPAMKKLTVWHSPSDKPVWWSKWLPFHPWGEMGRVGYKGVHRPRVRSINKEHNFAVSSCTHSDVFSNEKLRFFGPIIVKNAINKL